MIKTFRGLLPDGGQDRIRLQTIKGNVGYRILKYSLIARQPGAQSQESIVKIYKTEQTTIDGVVNFTDGDLLAEGYYRDNSNDIYPQSLNIIFDTEIFNQDIFITHSDVGGGGNLCNYYMELEVVPLTDMGAEYSTLKNIRTHVTSTI